MSEEQQKQTELTSQESTSQELTSQELVKKYKKQRRQSLILIFVALVAFVFAATAWFMNNKKVGADGMAISAEETRYEIAVKKNISTDKNAQIGAYDTEKAFGLSASARAEWTYGSDTYVLADYGNTSSLLVSEDSNMNNTSKSGTLFPGAKGKITIYLIPKVDDMTSVTVNLSMTPYKEVTDASNNTSIKKLADLTEEEIKALKIANKDAIPDLLSGHILFFRHKDEQNYYSNWLTDASFTVAATDAAYKDSVQQTGGKTCFKKDTPYEITFYWIWNERFQNLVYKDVTGKIFADTNTTEYDKMIKTLNGVVGEGGNADSWKMFFMPNTAAPDNTINTSMNQTTYDIYNDSYNQADQTIGYGVDYINTSISVEED